MDMFDGVEYSVEVWFHRLINGYRLRLTTSHSDFSQRRRRRRRHCCRRLHDCGDNYNRTCSLVRHTDDTELYRPVTRISVITHLRPSLQ